MAAAKQFDIVIVGGGAAGIATASSLLSRAAHMAIAVIEPADRHYYQPGWTMVGAGIFSAASTAKTTAAVMPAGVSWIKQAVTEFSPDDNEIGLADGSTAVSYTHLRAHET